MLRISGACPDQTMPREAEKQSTDRKSTSLKVFLFHLKSIHHYEKAKLFLLLLSIAMLPVVGTTLAFKAQSFGQENKLYRCFQNECIPTDNMMYSTDGSQDFGKSIIINADPHAVCDDSNDPYDQADTGAVDIDD